MCIRDSYYTVVEVTDPNHLTVDIPYAGETATGLTYTVQQIYLTPPDDFASFLSVIDQANNWKLHLTYAQEQLDYFDGQRVVLSLIHISEPTRLLSISYAVFCL